MRAVHLGVAVFLLALTACSVNKERVLSSTSTAEPPSVLAARAESLFAVSPRTPAQAEEAFRVMRTAAQGSDPNAPRRFRYLTNAAQYAVWAATYTDDASLQSTLAEAAITLCNTAIQMDSSQVEGFFYRAAAVGLFVQQNKLKGRSGMSDIRTDAQRAIELDSTYSDGGPYRILGTLYLRAPGPPAGIGSLRRALHFLKQAHSVAPTHPANVLRLAEAQLEAGDSQKAAGLLDSFDEIVASHEGAALAKKKWREEATALRRRLTQSSTVTRGSYAPSDPTHRNGRASSPPPHQRLENASALAEMEPK